MQRHQGRSCNWHGGINRNKRHGFKVTESETVFTFHSRQKELSFSTLFRRRQQKRWQAAAALTAAVNAAVSRSLWMREQRAITGGSSWWEPETFGEWRDVSILWLPLSYKHTHIHTELPVFTPARVLLTSCYNAGRCYQICSLSDAVHAVFLC